MKNINNSKSTVFSKIKNQDKTDIIENSSNTNSDNNVSSAMTELMDEQHNIAVSIIKKISENPYKFNWEKRIHDRFVIYTTNINNINSTIDVYVHDGTNKFEVDFCSINPSGSKDITIHKGECEYVDILIKKLMPETITTLQKANAKFTSDLHSMLDNI